MASNVQAELNNVRIRACHIFLFFKFQYWGVFFWCIFMCRTNVRKYIFFKNAIFLCKFDNQFYKGIGSKIQREMCRFGFLHFMLQNCQKLLVLQSQIHLSAQCGSFDTHIAMVDDILCHMAYVIKCHKMTFYDIL